MKTSYILIGGAVLVGIYLLSRKSATTTRTGTTSGASSWLTGTGNLLTGVSNVWDSYNTSNANDLSTTP